MIRVRHIINKLEILVRRGLATPKTTLIKIITSIANVFAEILSLDGDRRLVSLLGEINTAFSYNENNFLMIK